MRVTELPSPGQLSMGIKLRSESAKAISAIQLFAARTPGGQVATAAQLEACFLAAAAAVAPYKLP